MLITSQGLPSVLSFLILSGLNSFKALSFVTLNLSPISSSIICCSSNFSLFNSSLLSWSFFFNFSSIISGKFLTYSGTSSSTLLISISSPSINFLNPAFILLLPPSSIIYLIFSKFIFWAICNASNLSSKTFLIFLKPSFTWAKFALTLKLSACNLSATWSGILWIKSFASFSAGFIDSPFSDLNLEALDLNVGLGAGLAPIFKRFWSISLFFAITSLPSSSSSSSSSSPSSEFSLLWYELNCIFNFSLAWFNSFCTCSLLKACFWL